MDDFIPKPGTLKIGGLSRKAQKLQAMREKAAQTNTGAKPQTTQSVSLLQGQGLLRQHQENQLPAQVRLAPRSPQSVF